MLQVNPFGLILYVGINMFKMSSILQIQTHFAILCYGRITLYSIMPEQQHTYSNSPGYNQLHLHNSVLVDEG